ncbi:DUF1203 domain-containing protein [Asanoa siamensis]|nr:DUF1203 domain-containing protein [Asanoa siamensis]
MSFQIHAISPQTLERVRESGRDVSDHPVERVVATGGEPLRCCLRDARPAEDLILFGYEPELPASPYREIGPVFAHATVCPTPPAAGYPADFRGRRQVLRAYDQRGRIHPATRVHDGTDPEGEIAAMLADPEVDRIHSRNVAHGCYMFAITR